MSLRRIPHVARVYIISCTCCNVRPLGLKVTGRPLPMVGTRSGVGFFTRSLNSHESWKHQHVPSPLSSTTDIISSEQTRITKYIKHHQTTNMANMAHFPCRTQHVLLAGRFCLGLLKRRKAHDVDPGPGESQRIDWAKQHNKIWQGYVSYQWEMIGDDGKIWHLK